MRIAAVLSLPMGAGLAVLAKPIMETIYRGSHPAGPALLALLGLASIFVCMVLMENAVLQATGHELLPMISMIVGGVVKVVINYFLVAERSVNIYGAPIGTLVSYVVMAVMNFVFMCVVLDENPKLRNILIRPAVCTVVMAAFAWSVNGLAERFLPGGGRMHVLLCMLVAIVAAVAIYLFMTVSLRTITREDMKLIPGGEKLARLLHMR